MGRERRAYEGEERVVSSAIVFGRSQMSDPFFQSKSTVESLKEKRCPSLSEPTSSNLRLIDVVDTRT